MANLDIFDSFSAMALPLRIGLLVYPHCMPAGLLAFSDLLHAANRRAGRAIFATRYVAAQPTEVNYGQGLSLHVSDAFNDTELDAVMVPGFWAESTSQIERVLGANADLIRTLAAWDRSKRLWGYCTGVCLLAASGRLNGQPATVTWWAAEAMDRHYGKVRWQVEKSCIVNARTATASGVGGYLPIAQALIERHVSAEALHDLARLMVLPRPVQAHEAFLAMSLIEQGSPMLRRLHDLVAQFPAESITVARLADALGMSARTLARKATAETGVSIAEYARRIKLNQAGERLILTSAPVSTISADLGFSSDSNMRRMFKSLTSMTPAEYRRKFSRQL
ncbi:Transcriptional regulator GlxA family, contains an amidase domain and an AraC-type DNA-binding HTH domain [Cupriavidus sp. YR651]|uniref:GlxA family transcriptional regulator n=1 Tax=Cupriavidus sp. YR651 TaxID=1855315 RepID=UPI0008899CDD|nr:helix-turn-helix domain-containing protein [Cupriavidus sp. YR651]SDE00638.1 Transcriptional regulator GlxA family, contains an amidase domain and an AraC-type DNA-binding HTH domain [Cupriavidus sp. YR651]